MILVDVNVLVYASRRDSGGHGDYRKWWTSVVGGDEAFGVSDVVLSGFLRIVTHPKIFRPPTPIAQALAFGARILSQPHCVRVNPGPRHWEIFRRLCLSIGAKGNLVPDAYLAALAMESGCEWITTDRDYARFPGLRWRHPLQ